MISCHRASMLVSQSLDQPLAQRERLVLALHMLICKYCRRFRAQLGVVRRLVRRQLQSAPSPLEARLSAEARARIRRALSTEA